MLSWPTPTQLKLGDYEKDFRRTLTLVGSILAALGMSMESHDFNRLSHLHYVHDL